MEVVRDGVGWKVLLNGTTRACFNDVSNIC